MAANALFGKKLTVINIGLRTFAEGVGEQGVKTLQVSWRPPADKKWAKLLRKVL